MRQSKINQLNKALSRIQGLNWDINTAEFNNATESQIEKLQAREESACNKAYEICKTMTEDEYNASNFGSDMCMSYDEAIED